MWRILTALLAGGLFGLGLVISGMTDTQKVQGWLDIFGDWDPTLAFVMGGAILPMAIAWRLAAHSTPVLGGHFPEKPDPKFDRDLVLGSTLFGAGWGLVGLCPGPAIAGLSFGGWTQMVFFVALLLGMFATPSLRRRLDRQVGAG